MRRKMVPDTVFFPSLLAVAKLVFDRAFLLVIARIPGIQCGFHGLLLLVHAGLFGGFSRVNCTDHSAPPPCLNPPGRLTWCLRLSDEVSTARILGLLVLSIRLVQRNALAGADLSSGCAARCLQPFSPSSTSSQGL